jgi:hypothetical protein
LHVEQEVLFFYFFHTKIPSFFPFHSFIQYSV